MMTCPPRTTAIECPTYFWVNCRNISPAVSSSLISTASTTGPNSYEAVIFADFTPQAGAFAACVRIISG